MNRFAPTGRRLAALALIASTCLLAGCGGGGSGDGDGDLELEGPFLIDFETPSVPAADEIPESEPFAPGSNVTMESASNLFVWSNAPGWGTGQGECTVTLLGDQGCGSDDPDDDQTIFINFLTPVATVEIRVAARIGTSILFEALDANDGVVDTTTVVAPACPGPMALTRLVISPTSNQIHRIRINGSEPIIDNVSWSQFR